jgi:hypothetical protein
MMVLNLQCLTRTEIWVAPAIPAPVGAPLTGSDAAAPISGSDADAEIGGSDT